MSQLQKQLREGIARWLDSGKKSGQITSDSATVAISSALGNRSENQDRIIFLRVKFDEPSRSSIAALVLCDGMGGMVSGGDCANVAISTFAQSLIGSTASVLSDSLREATSSANQAVYERFHGKGGSTLSAVACNEHGKWSGINVGDSRVYGVLEDGTIRQLTVDDTLENQLADLKLPSPPPEFRQLLQYIGMGAGIEPRQIDFKSLPKAKWLLVTSDGAHGVNPDIFRSLVNNASSPDKIVHRLTKLSEWLGGKDNSTVAVITGGEELFLRDEKSAHSSLEIWGVPGKVEFLSIKPLRADSFKNEDFPTKEIANTSTPVANQTNSNSKKSTTSETTTKKRKKSSSRKESVKVLDNTDKKAVKKEEELKKDKPQLDIEFSTEEG